MQLFWDAAVDVDCGVVRETVMPVAGHWLARSGECGQLRWPCLRLLGSESVKLGLVKGVSG